MNEDRHIEEAVLAGEKNRDSKELIHNWCRHARVERFGGIGMIEMDTGLPIGHHSMACDHASASGMSAWSLADAAIDFYDRNCIDCKLRIPVRFPNLSMLVDRRDKALAENEKQQALIAEQASKALEKRIEQRASIKQKCKLASVTVLDQLDELDRHRDKNSNIQLTETARMAPEIFSSEIIEHFFLLLESGEFWFYETGFDCLLTLHADSSRLIKCAVDVLADYRFVESAVTVICKFPELIDVNKIGDIFNSLASFAFPPRDIFSNDSSPDRPDALFILFKCHPQKIKDSIQLNLDSANPNSICRAADTIALLTDLDVPSRLAYARSAMAKLARPHLTIDLSGSGRQNETDVYTSLEQVIDNSLHAAPKETDALIATFMRSADEEGQARILKPYKDLFNRYPPTKNFNVELHTLALRRILDVGVSARSYDLLSIVAEVFRSGSPDALDELVIKEATHILGVAVLLTPKLTELRSERKLAQDSLSALDVGNRYGLVTQIQIGLVKWTAEIAANHCATAETYLQVLSKIPDHHHDIRCVMISQLASMGKTVPGLALVLPPLYSALFNASQEVRAAGIEAIGSFESNRIQDMPDLVYEAFVLALSDPFVIVHRAAIRALTNVKIPERYTRVVKKLVYQLILVYSQSKDADSFLIKCISLYLSRYVDEKELIGSTGTLVVSQLARMDINIVEREIAWLGKKLSKTPGFAKILLDMLARSQRDSVQEKLIAALNQIDMSVIYEKRDSIKAIGLAQAADADMIGALIEILTRASAWEEALELSKAALIVLPDTTRNTARRLFVEKIRIAVEFEVKSELNSAKKLSELRNEWNVVTQKIIKDRKENEARRDPIRGIRGAIGGI